MSLATDTLRSLVGRIEVRTTAGNITFDDPFSPTPAGAPVSTVNALLHPAFTIFDQGGGEVYTAAPYGEPPVNLGPTLTFVGALALVWLGYRAFASR